MVRTNQILEDTEYTTDCPTTPHQTKELTTGRYMDMFYVERGTDGYGNTVVINRNEAMIVFNELKAYLEE